MRGGITGATMAAVMALAACSPQTPPSSASPSGPSASAPSTTAREFASEMLLTKPDAKPGQPTTMTAKVHVAGDKMRWEINDPDEGPVVMIATADATFIIAKSGSQQTAIKLPGSRALTDFAVQFPGLSEAMADASGAGVKVGSCTAAGVTGALYRLDGAAGSGTEVCVAPQGFPLESRENGKVVMQTTKFTPGPQDAALFAPPAGVPVQDMTELMKGIDPKALEAMEKAIQGR